MALPKIDAETEADYLRQARVGSHRAFRALVEPYRLGLQQHCYRMTGSIDDADDLVQETLFRAWRGLGAYVSRGSFRAWLYRIATNRTLDLLTSAPRKHEVVNSAGEPAWLQPYPTEGVDDRLIDLEAIGLAYVVALQNLLPRQRAAVLLCDVLGFTAAEAADAIDTTPAAVNSLLQRARASLEKIRPVTVTASSEAQKALVDRFVAAWRCGATDRMLALLEADAHLTMPPHPMEFVGRHAIVELLFDVERFAPYSAVDFVPVQANGEHGIATYIRRADRSESQRHCLMFFGRATRAARKITGFTEDRIFELFDLPSQR